MSSQGHTQSSSREVTFNLDSCVDVFSLGCNILSSDINSLCYRLSSGVYEIAMTGDLVADCSKTC